MSVADRLTELEDVAAKLLATAHELPPGKDRRIALQEIETFRARITALKDTDLGPERKAL
jgi:hypothetical protein